MLAIAGFAAAVVISLAAVGPTAMDLLFGGDFGARRRLGAGRLGMGSACAAGAFDQAALARGRAALAAATWLGCAALFLAWLALAPLDDSCWRWRSAIAPRPRCWPSRCG